MIKTQFIYNNIIQYDLVLDYFKQFKQQLIEENVKYIEFSIQIIPKDKSVEVHLCKHIKINIKTKTNSFLSVLKYNCNVLQHHFNNQKFTEIYFEYKEISYPEYIADKPSRSFKHRLLLNSLIKKVNKTKD